MEHFGQIRFHARAQTRSQYNDVQRLVLRFHGNHDRTTKPRSTQRFGSRLNEFACDAGPLSTLLTRVNALRPRAGRRILKSFRKSGARDLAPALQFHLDMIRRRTLAQILTLAIGALALQEPSALAQSYVVKGTGVYRANFEQCQNDLAQFTQRLVKAGVAEAPNLICKPVDGERDSHAPEFSATSQMPLVAETAMAGHVASQSDCQRVLEGLLSAVADENETIVESGCAKVYVTDTDSGDAQERFQPMVLLLRRQ